MKRSKFIEIIKKLIERERKLKEASTTANVPGYMTPKAFSGKGSKDGVPLDRRDSVASGSGYQKVNEDITSSGYSQLRKPVQGISVALKDLLKGLQRQNDDVVIPEIEYIYEKAEELMKILQNKKYNESINEFKNMKPGLKKALAQKGYGPIFFTIDQSKKQLKQLQYTRGEILDTLYTMFGKEDPKIVAKIKESVNKVNEGKYHDYRNDESMTPKQKIGNSMREVRNALTELGKLIDMNVRLKNELNVDSRSYWKNTHKALQKISERLVKLANKVGKMQ